MYFGFSITPFTTVGNLELVVFIISWLAQKQANSPDNLALILLNICPIQVLTRPDPV